MAVFTELLTPTKSEKHGAILWEAKTTDDSPLAGLLTITGKRCHQTYEVSEFPADFAGRAFTLKKADGSGFYSVFIGAGSERICDCRGHAAHGRCKHASALEALVQNGQI